MKMEWQYGSALDGNVAVMGEVDIARTPRVYGRRVVSATAITRRFPGLMQTLSTPYPDHAKRFVDQWHPGIIPERPRSRVDRQRPP